jgi:hypothetical protein
MPPTGSEHERNYCEFRVEPVEAAKLIREKSSARPESDSENSVKGFPPPTVGNLPFSSSGTAQLAHARRRSALRTNNDGSAASTQIGTEFASVSSVASRIGIMARQA